MPASQPANFNLQEFTDLGQPLVGGRLYTYAYGTTAQKTAFTDPDGTVPHTYTLDGAGGQYIALNARGELPAPLYLGDGSYDISLKRADGTTVWTRKADGVENSIASWMATLLTAAGSSLIGSIQDGISAVKRTVLDKLSDTVNTKDWGTKCDGVTDDWAKAQACINDSVGKGKTVVITGVLAISAPLEIKNGVNVRCEGTIKALPNFVGASVVTVGASGRYTNGLINGLRIDGSGKNIKGLVVSEAQSSFFNDTVVQGCLDTGIQTVLGYEHFFNRFWILGAAAGMTANAPGLLAGAGDSHYTEGVVTLYPIGVKAQAGNCVFTRIHPWAVYTAGSTPMLHGFWCTGEGNRFDNCTPDSPDLTDRTAAPSLANGGYGFYVDATAINSSFNACKLIVASNANAPVAKLWFGYVSASYCTFMDCRTDDNSAHAMAGNLGFPSSTRARQTAVFGVFAAGRMWLGDTCYGTFTPTVLFGGVEISTQGGGYFPSRQAGWWWRAGPLVTFVIHLRLTSKGAGAGAVTVDGLPVALLDPAGNVYSWPVETRVINPGISAKAAINATAPNQIALYDTATGNALDAAAIGINQELWISGTYAASAQP